MQYKEGTVTVYNGSPVVTGHGTKFLSNVSIGNSPPMFMLPRSGVYYQVADVLSDTDLRLSAPFAQADAISSPYSITKDFTPLLGLPEISSGDVEWPYLLTQTLRKLDSYLGGSLIYAMTPPPDDPTKNYALVSLGGNLGWYEMVEISGDVADLTESRASGTQLAVETGTATAVSATSNTTTTASGIDVSVSIGSASATASGTAVASGSELAVEAGAAVGDVGAAGTALAIGLELTVEAGTAAASGAGSTAAAGLETTIQAGTAAASAPGSVAAAGMETAVETGSAVPPSIDMSLFDTSVAGTAVYPSSGPTANGIYVGSNYTTIKTPASTDAAILVRKAAVIRASSVKTFRAKFAVTAMVAGGGGCIPLQLLQTVSEPGVGPALTVNGLRSLWVDVWSPSSNVLEIATYYVDPADTGSGSPGASAPKKSDCAIGTVYHAEISINATQFRVRLLDASLTELISTGWLNWAATKNVNGATSLWAIAGKAYNNAQNATLQIYDWYES